MFKLNQCFECSYRCQLRPPLPKSLLKIQQANRTMNPKLRRFIDQLIDQRFKDHDPRGHDYFTK